MFPFPNPIIGASLIPPSSWNPADADGGLTVTNNNRDIVGSNNSGNQGIRGTTSKTAGKHYLEYQVLTAGSGALLGLATGSASLSAFLPSGTAGIYSDGRLIIDGSLTYTLFGSPVVGTIIGVALDITAAKAWWAFDNTWDYSGTPGVSGGWALPTGFAAGLFPYATALTPASCRSKFAASQLTYAPPSGFSAWG